MPHYYNSWTRTHREHLGDGPGNDDSPAGTDGPYLANEYVDDNVNGEIIVPAVHVEELTTFPPVGKSPPFDGEDAADSFVWDGVGPAQGDSGSGLVDVGLDLAAIAADAAGSADAPGDSPAFALLSADATDLAFQDARAAMEGDGLFI